MASVTAVSDSLLNHQLASALSTMGDAQFWEESISPATIRQSLAEADPSNPSHTHNLLRGMKWLLASISKGRNVSDFYSHVVKLVGATSIQVRKLVYMYLVQYADHDATTRELSLLSINSFQRGLADSEQLIRALALRVLTSIRLADILQIQILGVQKCAQDKSPYVRKCAANALAKLFPRCDADQQDMLMEIMVRLLDTDDCTMVLTSALIAFSELCPSRLELLHASFRKICHLLTDMDEWGQVVVIDLLARYCRQFFKEPVAWQEGTAERIDRERRVRRVVTGIDKEIVSSTSATAVGALVATTDVADSALVTAAATTAVTLPPHPGTNRPKRRVVKKGFYSDEEDESTEEEVQATPIAGLPGQRNILGVPSGHSSVIPEAAINLQADEDSELDEDHRLLLRSAMPLLKSRNSGVVLAVCSLQYYCGVSSVKVRAAMGKALVRIHRDRREIQYVVLSSIRTLAKECPSAFAPFLHDFFIKAMDPPFTRLIKMDILTSLALEPAAIEAVLKELRNYIRHGDKSFACEAVRAVGRIAEMARIVHDRHGAKTGNAVRERADANAVALNCLYGLLTLTQTSDSKLLVGESVVVMQWILQMLVSDAGPHGDLMNVDDPNLVQDRACRRIVLLLVNTLSSRVPKETPGGNDEEENNEEDEVKQLSRLEKLTVVLPARACSSALWFAGELLSQDSSVSSTAAIFRIDGSKKTKLRLEISRLLARSFPDLKNVEKEQAIHFCSKLLVSKTSGVPPLPNEGPLCEQVLAMGRLDVNPDVRDRARFESGVLRHAGGLQHDLDAVEDLPALPKSISLEDAQKMLLGTKPSVSTLPLEDESSRAHAEVGDGFRFGTLSSIVGHRARSAYLPLPKWASKNSDHNLREPPKVEKKEMVNGGGSVGWNQDSSQAGAVEKKFYEGEESSSDDDASSTSSSSASSSSESSTSSAKESSSSSSESESSSDDEGSDGPPLQKGDDDGVSNLLLPMQQPTPLGNTNGSALAIITSANLVHVEDVSEDSSSYGADGDNADRNLIPMGVSSSIRTAHPPTNGSSVADDLKGLVMAPVVIDADAEPTDPDMDRDSSVWAQLVRADLSGGLSVHYRYVRGVTRVRQAQLMGFAQPKPNFVCLQFRLENVKTDAISFRHIRLAQRAAAKSSTTIGPSRVCLPAEIAVLAPGEKVECIVGIEFASASDREGSLQAKLDIKFGGGGIPIEIKPSLGDVLQRCKITADEFDAAVRRLQGFQRVESSFSVEIQKRSVLPLLLARTVALTAIGGLEWQDDRLRLAGKLPASSDPVFVLVHCDENGQGKLTVCCDHALAVNGIVNSLRRAIQDA